MYVIELFLPLYNNRGKRQPKKLFVAVRNKLIEHFGGMTAHAQTPVKGLWKDQGHTEEDELVIFEVMSPTWIGAGGAANDSLKISALACDRYFAEGQQHTDARVSLFDQVSCYICCPRRSRRPPS